MEEKTWWYFVIGSIIASIIMCFCFILPHYISIGKSASEICSEAQIGMSGSDVIKEFGSPNQYQHMDRACVMGYCGPTYDYYYYNSIGHMCQIVLANGVVSMRNLY